MKHNKLFLLALMIVPWFSVQLLGKKAFKRFLPGALFMAVWVMVESILSRKRTWWSFYEKLIPRAMGEIPFIVGPFFIGSLWILKFTFGKFWRYFFVNLITDFLFAYPGMIVLRRMGIVSLIRLKHYQMGILFLSKSVLMYGFQAMMDKKRNRPKSFLHKFFS